MGAASDISSSSTSSTTTPGEHSAHNDNSGRKKNQREADAATTAAAAAAAAADRSPTTIRVLQPKQAGIQIAPGDRRPSINIAIRPSKSLSVFFFFDSTTYFTIDQKNPMFQDSGNISLSFTL